MAGCASRWSAVLLLVIVSILSMTTSCSDDNTPVDAPMLKGKIASYNEFGGAMLDFTEADMAKAGFTLGDVISITIDDRSTHWFSH